MFSEIRLIAPELKSAYKILSLIFMSSKQSLWSRRFKQDQVEEGLLIPLQFLGFECYGLWAYIWNRQRRIKGGAVKTQCCILCTQYDLVLRLTAPFKQCKAFPDSGFLPYFCWKINYKAVIWYGMLNAECFLYSLMAKIQRWSVVNFWCTTMDSTSSPMRWFTTSSASPYRYRKPFLKIRQHNSLARHSCLPKSFPISQNVLLGRWVPYCPVKKLQ